MGRYRDGDHIHLLFDGYEDGEHPEYIKGHVDIQKAREVLDREFYEEIKVMDVEHKYAFWGFADSFWRSEGCDHQLIVRDKLCRGCFKVTEIICKRGGAYEVGQQ